MSLTLEMWLILTVSSKYKEHINAEYFSAFFASRVIVNYVEVGLLEQQEPQSSIIF